MSLPLLSESVELPESLGKKEKIKAKLVARLKEEGLDLSIEDGQIGYEDFFNGVSISPKLSSKGGEVAYSISITAKCLTAIILGLLLLLPAGVILVVVWYMKYSRLSHSIRSALGSLTQA